MSKRTITVFIDKKNFIQYERNGEKDKTLSVKEYLDIIRPYLSNIINDHKTKGD